MTGTGGEAPDSTGPPDRQTIRLLERHCSSDSLVSGVEFDPDPHEPRRLGVTLDTARYPDSIVRARVDIQWFATDDFSFHYVESHADDTRWDCRWDRHPNPDNSRLHFHQPPDSAAVSDLHLQSTHPLDVYSTVFEAIQQRLETLWERDRKDR